MKYLTNAFSLNMINKEHWPQIRFEPVTSEATVAMMRSGELTSAVSHQNTIDVMKTEHGVNIPFSKRMLTIDDTDEMYVIQYRGPNLRSNTRRLPDGAQLNFVRVYMEQ